MYLNNNSQENRPKVSWTKVVLGFSAFQSSPQEAGFTFVA